MKRLLTLILLLALTLSALTGCMSVENPDGDKEQPEFDFSTGGGSEGGEEGGDEPTDPDAPFTVTLKLNEERFTETAGMSVEWTSTKGDEVHRAAFDKTTRVASVSGLNGSYVVTLIGLPEKYRYNYNAEAHIATNSKRDIEIEVYEYITTKGEGADFYSSAISTTRLGAYTATVKDRGEQVYYRFIPNRAGTYIIETMCDVNEDDINPTMYLYGANFAFQQMTGIVNSGGSEGEYTRNVYYVIDVDATNVGATYPFSITATSKHGNFPAGVDFIIRRMSDYERDKITKTDVHADTERIAEVGMITDDFLGGTNINYPEIKVRAGVYRYEGSMFGINPDDGFYHLYNEESGKYDGPILFVKISKRTRFFYDYTPPGGSPMETSFQFFGPSDPVGSVSGGSENYNPFIDEYDAYIANDEGVYPVTDEIREFLMKFVIAQAYFSDGEGWAETTAEDDPSIGYRIYSSEEDMWLFACCYYT